MRAFQTVKADLKELQDRAITGCASLRLPSTAQGSAGAGIVVARRRRLCATQEDASYESRAAAVPGSRVQDLLGRRWPRERGEVRRARSNSFEVGVERRVLCSRAVGGG